MVAAPDGTGGAFDIVGYGSQSTNGSGLAQYFLPNCKNTLTVREKVTAGDGTDLQARNFGIITTNGVNPLSPDGFESIISFCAKHTEAGVGLHWKQGFGFNEDNSKWWYLDIDLPITYVRNQFLISENVISNGGGINVSAAASGIPVSPNMTVAMMQSAWNYGKVSNCCKLSKTGVADIELKFARQFMYSDECMIAGYVGALIPTGNAPCAKYIFEPIVGHGKHAGVIWGSEGGYEIWTNCDESWKLWLDYGCQAMYLFKHCEFRSFDLKNRPWSRYISVYLDQAQAAQANASADSNIVVYLSTPGINVLTQPVSVTPGFQTNTTAALVFSQDCGLNVELGWNVFFREGECVQLNWLTGPAIKAVGGDGATNPVLNITGNPLLVPISVPFADFNTSLIQQADIDIQSAAHPNITTQLVYGQFGWDLDDGCYPMHFGLGASYEFALKNFAVMNRWVIWGKFGFAF